MEAIDVLEAGFVRHREDDEESIPCPHVLLPHCTELLLAGCVQHCGHRGHKYASLRRKTKWNLKRAFALTIQYGPLLIDLCVFEVRVLYRGIVVWHKNFLEKLDGQGALPDAAIPHHHQLVCWQVVARYGAGRHLLLLSAVLKGEKSAGGGLARHTWLRWMQKGMKMDGQWRGEGTQSEQGSAAFSSPWRPRATSVIGKNKKWEKPKESSVPFQISFSTNTRSCWTVIYG